MVRKVSFYITTFLALLVFIYIFFNQLSKGLYLVGDTSFHVSRIYDIRQSFFNHEIPLWINFHSFFGLGQAVNGMYPDISLWPFIMLTLWMPFHTQIVVINGLIFILTLCVSFFTFQNHKVNVENAILASIIYAFSGYCIYAFIYEFQPGTAVIYCFSFPILYFIKDVLEKDVIDFRLVIKGALIFTLILYSHLLSAVIFATVFVIAWLVNILINNRINFFTLINMLLSGCLALICSMPIIYRTFLIEKSGISSPFGKGHVTAESFMDVFIHSDIISRTSISIIALALMVIVLCNETKDSKIISALLVEFVLILMCTDVMPWTILGKLPLINMLQYTPWRFGIWLSVIPLYVFLRSSWSKYSFNIGGVILVILAIVSVVSSAGKFHDASSDVARLNEDAPLTYYFHDRKFNNIYNRILVKDYSPNGSNNVGEKDKVQKHTRIMATNPTIKVKGKSFKLRRKPLRNGVMFSLDTDKKVYKSSGHLMLPVYGYKSLLKQYTISINGKKIDRRNYAVSNGWLTIYNVKENNINNIKVQFSNPKIYVYTLCFSIFIILLLIFILGNMRGNFNDENSLQDV
ncbi:hypothetical protein [uncultured Limosilactobacillus sp.]|uniref:hypothetical protein n=1 Tax=uncultured Limosilactobacillus sp. TaxID=2837629 RepID=UPI0025DD3E6B|nr:hypothetical protein [uncultured Limosilactobacillus sp.]